MGRRLAEEIIQALSEQTVEVEQVVTANPLEPILTSMPGVGVRTAARLITDVSGKEFATARHRPPPRLLRRPHPRH